MGATKLIVQEKSSFMEFHCYPVGSQTIILGNSYEEDVVGVRKPSMDHLHQWGSTAYVYNSTHKHEKLGPRATKMVFIRYPPHSKGYVIYGEYPNGGMT